MEMQDILDVVNTAAAASLSLSKGGWEGWVQCELWRHLVDKGESAEREAPYPVPYSNLRCDLVADADGTPLWVEIKAFGVFRHGDEVRFLDSVSTDVMKLGSKPEGAIGLAVVIVPNAIADSFRRALSDRGWHGFKVQEAEYVSVFHLQF
ncbi:MAG: hypothetical protein EPN36_03655 [Rhodanobacteraceae bacterium]|nr:MAG: hypothetical protein EPN36_03655 [Rhodanobacteraceae bacterium]